MEFDPIKAGSLGVLCSFAIVLDDSLNLRDFQGAMWRGFSPTVGRGSEALTILPIRRVDRCRNRHRPFRYLNVRRTSGVPELGEHPATLGMDRVHDLLPALDLLIGVEAGCSEPATCRGGNGGRFRND